MSKYSIKYRPPSVDVDLSFVERVETYLREKAPSMLGLDSSYIPKYAISFIDSNGEETFDSIREYPHDCFDSDLVSLRLSETIGDELAELSIALGLEPMKCRIRLEVDSPNAKAVAHGIRQELDTYFRSNRNNNWMFHGPVSDWMGWIVVISGFGAMIAWDSSDPVTVYGWTTLFAVSVLYWLTRRYFPYVVFDTQRTSSIKNGLSWALKIGFALALGALTAHHLELFGFLVPG